MSARDRKQRALMRQIDRLGRALDRYQQRSDQFVRWRTGVFAGGLVLLFLAFQVSDGAAAGVGLLWLALWLVVSRRHGRVKRMMRRFVLWREIKRGHLARMRLDWAALPPAAAFDVPADHPFARDLDMVGERSLHHLLDTALSRGGSRRLFDWLLDQQPNAARAQARQAVVRDLLPLEAFRDKLALAARLTAEARPRQGRWDVERLRVWLARHRPADDALRYSLAGLGALSAVTLGLLALYLAEVIAQPLWAYTLAVYALGFVLATRNLGGLFTDALTIQDELRRLGAALAHLETYAYGDRAQLAALCAPFHAEPAHRPSRELRRAGWVAAGASLRGNPLVWFLVNAAVPWDLAFAYWLGRVQHDLSERVPVWLEALYDLEAYNALAAFAAHNPAATFPTFTGTAAALLEAHAIGHPLIAAENRVTNSFTLDRAGQVVILTGSNMSGKSSFLRTLGVNVQLAYAGSPALADSLTLSDLRVYTSIRVSDSVQDGFSYFYAEVRRLKALLDALHDADGPPLLFLIDEIFRGTNNRERLLGSRAYIRALVGGRGLGLIATHDLDLVKLADEDSRISNAHFREEVADGRIVFDYRLRPGPCPTTNALKIMALEGLPVEAEDAVR